MKHALQTATNLLAPRKCQDPLPPATRTAFKAAQTRKILPEGCQLFAEGEAPMGIYVLCAGRVRLSISDDLGETLIIGSAVPGDILGLSAVLAGKCHEETAETLITSRAGFVSCKDFLHFLDHHPEAAFWVVQLLSDHLTLTCKHLPRLRRAFFQGI